MTKAQAQSWYDAKDSGEVAAGNYITADDAKASIDQMYTDLLEKSKDTVMPVGGYIGVNPPRTDHPSDAASKAYVDNLFSQGGGGGGGGATSLDGLSDVVITTPGVGSLLAYGWGGHTQSNAPSAVTESGHTGIYTAQEGWSGGYWFTGAVVPAWSEADFGTNQTVNAIWLRSSDEVSKGYWNLKASTNKVAWVDVAINVPVDSFTYITHLTQTVTARYWRLEQSPSTTTPNRSITIKLYNYDEAQKTWADMDSSASDGQVLTIDHTQGSGMKWADPTSTGATYLVAASDAPVAIRNSADYLCDGIADNVEISAAITAANGKGTVILSGGTFQIADTVAIRTSNSVLRGSGNGATRLYLVNGTNKDVVSILGDGVVSVEISNMKIDGNRAGNTAGNGVYINTAYAVTDAYHYLLNLDIFNVVGNGVHIEVAREVRAAFCRARSISRNGWVLSGSDHKIVACTASATKMSGFVTYGGNIQLVGCKAFYCAETPGSNYAGFRIEGKRNFLTGCEAQDNNETGIYLTSTAENCTLTGCIADSNGKASAAPGFSGLLIQGKNNSITGGQFYDRAANTNKQVYGITISDSTNPVAVATGNHIVGENYSGNKTGTYNDISTGQNSRNLKHNGDTMIISGLSNMYEHGGLTIKGVPDYPQINFNKTNGPAHHKLWKMYIAGAAGSPNQTPANDSALSFVAKNDDGSDSYDGKGLFRMFRDGRFTIGGKQAATEELGTWSPSTSWKALSPSVLMATRVGKLVTLEGQITPKNGNFGLVDNTLIQIGSVSGAFIPVGNPIIPVTVAYSSAMSSVTAGFIEVQGTDGKINFLPLGTATVVRDSGWIAVNITYRVA